METLPQTTIEKPYPFPAPRTPENRPCQECGKATPVTEVFRSKPEGQPVRHVCAQCLEPIRGKSREALKVEEAREKLTGLLGGLAKGRHAEAPSYLAYVTALVDEFGGVERMAAWTAEQIRAAADPAMGGKPGSKRVLDAMQGIARMLAVAWPMMNELPDVTRMTDEELRKELEEQTETIVVARIMEKYPELREVFLSRQEAIGGPGQDAA